jgi:hypothetical protein
MIPYVRSVFLFASHKSLEAIPNEGVSAPWPG